MPEDEVDGRSRARAIKVLRPGVRQRFRQDLDSCYAAARFLDRFVPAARRLKPLDVVATLDRSATLELDLRIEAAALSEMGELTRDDPGFRVPAVDWQLTGRDVLAIEWIDGIKLSDVEAIDRAGHDRVALGAMVVQSFLRHALRDGFFHADMHEGNLFVDGDGMLVAVDFGIMGRLGIKERRFLAEILHGFIRRDYLRIAEVHFEAGYVPPIHAVEDFAQALRAVGEPIQGKRAREISMAKLLGLLFEITDLFDMQTRPELIMLQKTMVVVEGVARKLDPDFDMWKTAAPIVADWIAQNLGPGRYLREAADGAGSLVKLAGQLPVLADRADRLSAAFTSMAQHGLTLDPATVAAIADAEARRTRSGRIGIWIGAAALVGLLLIAL
jgi:ubiquinone biosynthesis protein